MDGELSLSAMERIAKKATGARVAAPAKEALRDAAEEYLSAIAKDAWAMAENARRRTIKRQDVQLALKMRTNK